MRFAQSTLLPREPIIFKVVDASADPQMGSTQVVSPYRVRLLSIWDRVEKECGKSQQLYLRLVTNYSTRASRYDAKRLGVTKFQFVQQTGNPHTTLAGFVGDKEKAQYKTNKACPYPEEFCDYGAPLITKPIVHFEQQGEIRTDDVDKAIFAATSVGPRVSMQAPSADHYITHLPKHPGCKACMHCKVQRKH